MLLLVGYLAGFFIFVGLFTAIVVFGEKALTWLENLGNSDD